MLFKDCKTGMTVRDTRNGKEYTVTGFRLHSTDNGAWVRETEPGPDDIEGISAIHWTHLEPVDTEKQDNPVAFTTEELTTLEDALEARMTDAYGTENEEGCWSPEQWTGMESLALKLAQLHARVGL